MSSRVLRAVRAVEAEREEMRQPSFLATVFAGEPDFSLVLPFPEQDPEDRRIGDEIIARLGEYLRDSVDSEQIEREGRIPPAVLRGLADLGAFGMTIPREYGGLGFSQTNYDRVLTFVASHTNILALVLSVHQSIGVARPILMFGTEEQKRRFLPDLARGRISGFALTEPQIGSDPANMATTAVLDGDHYVVNGEKLWTTNGPIAEVIVLTARVEGRVTAFILETNTPGVEVLHRCEFMGCRGIENAWLRFVDVRIPRENLLGQVGRGLRIALTLLNVGRVSVAAICLGMAKQVLPPTIGWANQRVAFGKPIGQHELNTHKIARMAADVFAMDAVTWHVSGLVDRGRSDFRVEAAAAKLVCSERLWSVVDSALQIRGGRGYEKAWSLRARGEEPVPIEQIFRDARLYLIGEGASEILKLFIAREVWDPHIKRATPFFEAEGADKAREAARLARHYAGWYFERMAPRRGRDGHAGADPFLTPFLRYVEATSRRLARVGFELMVRHRAGLEERQALVTRLADAGVELYVIAAAAAYSMTVPGSGPLAHQVLEAGRRRIEELFRAIGSNDDEITTARGLGVLRGAYPFLGDGAFTTGAAPTGARSPAGTANASEPR